jgi:hypothetical protein
MFFRPSGALADCASCLALLVIFISYHPETVYVILKII